ncbi:MAG: GFA family protein [Gammaproteobacteria bacterium]|nr:GFA family protein [Gammaproteobacteria bacterium]
MTSMTGKCLCGEVRFTASDVETSYHVCHCGMCRRWSGAPLFATTVGDVHFESDADLAVYDSSEWAQRGFCRHCGSNLFYRLKDSGAYFMSVGAFDDPAPFTLVGELYVDHQPGGYRFAGDLSQMTQAEVEKLFAPPQ